MSISVTSSLNSTIHAVDIYLSNSLKQLDGVVYFEPQKSALAKVTFTQLGKSTERAVLLHKHEAMKVTCNEMRLKTIISTDVSKFLKINFNTRKRPGNTIKRIIIKDNNQSVRHFIPTEDNAKNILSSARSVDDKILAGSSRSLELLDFVRIEDKVEDLTAPQIKIQFIDANSIEYLYELKNAKRSQETSCQSKSSPLVDDYYIIKKWLQYTHLGGLKTSLLNLSSNHLSNIFANNNLPSSLEDLLKDNTFKNTIVEIEANQDFFTFQGSSNSRKELKMIKHLQATELFKTPEGKWRLAQQIGFILFRYQQCVQHRDLIKNILSDVMSRCVDRAQRQLSTAVLKTALFTTSSHELTNNEVAGLLVVLYKEFIIDQASIAVSGFSKESVEDALYVRHAFASLFCLTDQGKVYFENSVNIKSYQQKNLLIDICYQFSRYDNLILFIRDHEEMMDALVAKNLPSYQLRIENIHAKLHELSERIDDPNFSNILDHFLHLNNLLPMTFEKDNSFYYYEHVQQQLKADSQLPVLIVLKILNDAEYLDQRALEYCPELISVNTWNDLYILAQERIPWLIEPSTNDLLNTVL